MQENEYFFMQSFFFVSITTMLNNNNNENKKKLNSGVNDSMYFSPVCVCVFFRECEYLVKWKKIKAHQINEFEQISY